jgi:hypothetical protein
VTNETVKQVAGADAGAATKGSSRAAVIVTCLVAAMLGYVVGARGSLPFGPLGQTSTPLARLGFALQQDAPPVDPGLRGDIDAIRASWTGQERDVLDLVVAVRGLAHDGESDWDLAARLCRGLKWPRCDRPALEQLKERSRP